MKLGSFAMQILAAPVLFLQQALLSGWDGPFLLVFKSGGTEARRSKVKSPGLERRLGVSHIPTAASRPPDPGTSLQGRYFPKGSSMFSGIQFIFPVTGGGACGQGGIAISKDFIGFALK